MDRTGLNEDLRFGLEPLTCKVSERITNLDTNQEIREISDEMVFDL